MSDVYAGDDDLTALTKASAVSATYNYVIIADADPDFLLKVASQFLLTNSLPERLLLTHPSPQQVIVEVELTSVSPRTADALRRKLLQMSSTQSVSMTVQ